MFLAEGVAAVTTAAASVATISDLLSAQNITALLAFLGMIAGFRGKSGLATKLATASAAVGDHQEQIQTASSLLRVVIQGVENAKGNMSPEDKAKLLAAIKEASAAAGMEASLKPVVAAVTGGGVDVSALAQLLATVTEKLQTTQPAKPQQGPAA